MGRTGLLRHLSGPRQHRESSELLVQCKYSRAHAEGGSTLSRRVTVLPVRVLRPWVARSGATMRRAVERHRQAKLVDRQAVVDERAERLGTNGTQLNPEVADPHLVCRPISVASV